MDIENGREEATWQKRDLDYSKGGAPRRVLSFRIVSKKIGVIGSGIVGETLARGFVTHGYTVMIGTNTPFRDNSWRHAFKLLR